MPQAPPIFPQALYSGDDIPLTLNFFQSDGITPQSLVGVTIGCTVKNEPTDADAAALFQQDIVGDATGVIKFTIPPLNVGTYYLDVKWWNTSTTPQTRQTVIGSMEFVVNQSITARTAP